MERRAGEEATSGIGDEVLLAEATSQQQREPSEPAEIPASEASPQLEGRRHRRERGEERTEERLGDPRPLVVEALPRLAIAGSAGIAAGDRLPEVSGQHWAGAVEARVGEYDRRMSPPQAVVIEPQLCQHRRSSAKHEPPW